MSTPPLPNAEVTAAVEQLATDHAAALAVLRDVLTGCVSTAYPDGSAISHVPAAALAEARRLTGAPIA